ncbi:Uncharacterised protein [uncultured archaeon]|nr:Uncharacterised protein [uncultured archaeon]
MRLLIYLKYNKLDMYEDIKAIIDNPKLSNDKADKQIKTYFKIKELI